MVRSTGNLSSVFNDCSKFYTNSCLVNTTDSYFEKCGFKINLI